MRRTFMFTLVLAAVAAGVVPAVASAGPATFAEAQQGKLHVLSSVFVHPKSVDLMGGWFHNGLSCSAMRRIRVFGEVTRATANSSGGTGASKTRVTMNCGEGGPNVGFHWTAVSAGFACPNGSWRPGRYDFTARTRHLASGLVATASLGWTKKASC